MTKELALSTKDLKDVGINAQLTSNDLLEVVANDIFEKFMAEVNGVVAAERALRDKVHGVLNPEYDQMKSELTKAKFLKANEEVNTGYSKVNGEDWRSSIAGWGLLLNEKERGTHVRSESRSFSLSYPSGLEAKVKLKMTCDEKEEGKSHSINGIDCKVYVTTRKEFERVVIIKTDRFKSLVAEIKAHNKRVEQVIDALPANGILSVERFTREARVKMNKKIISAQSPDFRKKISQLFNISL